jgi:hypothetical protein
MDETDVNDLPDLVTKALEITESAPDREWWFRGHGRSSWSLTPSLYRLIPDVPTALDTEGQLVREFDNRSRVVVEREAARNGWELAFLMQHHRVPTRLLDWSRNLLIGAFFAAYDDDAWLDAGDPPCVFVFNPERWNSKVVGPAGMAVAGPSGVMTELTEGVMTSYEPRASGNPVGPLQRHAVAIAGPEFAPRIVAQRGVFMVFGALSPHAAESLEEQEVALAPDAFTLSKLRLVGDREHWRRALRLVGIGEFTAFPDLDGLARELRDKYF